MAVLFFAQLGPLLLLSPVGGVLADVFDRRRLLLACQIPQLVFSLVLALLATSSHPDEVLLAVCVLIIGIANALGAPALSSILPTLVPKPDLPGAVSLQSVQMNLSRVIGPAIGAAIYAGIGTRFGAYSICEAVSDDGLNWERGQPGENLALAPAGTGWESKMTEYPNVIEENGKLRLFYCGNGYGTTGIGTALADMLD